MKPRYEVSATPPLQSTHLGIYTACVIARRFRAAVPTVQQLQEAFGMSRATAYRWRAAIRAAAGDEIRQQHTLTARECMNP